MVPKEIEEIVKNGAKLEQQYAYIPKRLEVVGRGELEAFPLNILFVSHKTNGKQVVTAEALYIPSLKTFKVGQDSIALNYFNKYNPENKVTITVHPKTGGYEGEKIISGQSVLTAFGNSWQEFFIHLGMNGLSEGEGCLLSLSPYSR